MALATLVCEYCLLWLHFACMNGLVLLAVNRGSTNVQHGSWSKGRGRSIGGCTISCVIQKIVLVLGQFIPTNCEREFPLTIGSVTTSKPTLPQYRRQDPCIAKDHRRHR